MFGQYLVIICLMITKSKCDESYTNKYDGVDLAEILASERLLNGYVSCLLGAGPCTPDGNELKKNLPDAILNDCMKCTERQRAGAETTMHYIIEHRPADWDKLELKYSSDGSYKREYLTRLHPEQEKSTNKSKEYEENLKDKLIE